MDLALCWGLGGGSSGEAEYMVWPEGPHCPTGKGR